MADASAEQGVKRQVQITLPDGSRRDFDGPVTGADIAASIGPRLAKDALAVVVDGQVRDLAREIAQDAAVEIVTRGHAEALPLLRHDCAHVLAEAVQELYPDTQVTFGPATEDGFYYDFARAEPFTPEDLEAIEARMHEIVERDEAIGREVWERHHAIRHFEDDRREVQGRAHRDPCPRTRISRSTARATGSTSASARTCPRPASSATPSS